MTKTMTRPVQSTEEMEAAAEEQIVPISKDGLTKSRRLHKLRAQMKRLKAEEEEISAFLQKELAEQGAKVLAYKGVPVCAIEATTKVTTNTKLLFSDFPQLRDTYETRDTDATRFVYKAVV